VPGPGPKTKIMVTLFLFYSSPYKNKKN